MTTDYTEELTAADRSRLGDAARKWGDFDPRGAGVTRYCFYRRRGYAKADAMVFTFAYLRNVIEQYERCLSHDTGAEGWREVG